MCHNATRLARAYLQYIFFFGWTIRRILIDILSSMIYIPCMNQRASEQTHQLWERDKSTENVYVFAYAVVRCVFAESRHKVIFIVFMHSRKYDVVFIFLRALFEIT